MFDFDYVPGLNDYSFIRYFFYFNLRFFSMRELTMAQTLADITLEAEPVFRRNQYDWIATMINELLISCSFALIKYPFLEISKIADVFVALLTLRSECLKASSQIDADYGISEFVIIRNMRSEQTDFRVNPVNGGKYGESKN